MYNSSKNYNNHPTYIHSLSRGFEPKCYTSLSTNQNPNIISTPSYQQAYTFSKDFYTNNNLYSAHRQRPYNSKYRSTSLPSQCLVRNIRANNFSYYDQLKRRDYIVTKNCRSFSDLKNKELTNNERSKFYNYQSETSLQNTDLKRFLKFDPQKKLSRNNNVPIIKTNIKLFDRPDQSNKFTHIKSNFYSSNAIYTDGGENRRVMSKNQTPIVECSIDVKSDDGKYYSTVQSQFPAVLTNQQTFYDNKNKIYTTEATMVRDFSHSFDNLCKPFIKYQQSQILNPSLKQLNFKEIDQRSKELKKLKDSKQYDIYVVKKKKTSTKIAQNKLGNSEQQLAYLRSMENKNHNITLNEKLQIKSPIKRKIIIEYLANSPRKLKSPQTNRKRRSSSKKQLKNAELKYNYSKYYLAEMETKKQNRSKSKSMRKGQKSQRKQNAKGLLSKHNVNQKTIKKCADAYSPKCMKNNEKFNKPCQMNYTSTHLLTAKK